MQKTRRLVDENSVSFQIFLILLSFITLGSESQISVFKQFQINTQMFFFGGRSMRRSQHFFSEKKNLIKRCARFNILRLSFAFISKYYPILHVVKK